MAICFDNAVPQRAFKICQILSANLRQAWNPRSEWIGCSPDANTWSWKCGVSDTQESHISFVNLTWQRPSPHVSMRLLLKMKGKWPWLSDSLPTFPRHWLCNPCLCVKSSFLCSQHLHSCQSLRKNVWYWTWLKTLVLWEIDVHPHKYGNYTSSMIHPQFWFVIQLVLKTLWHPFRNRLLDNDSQFMNYDKPRYISIYQEQYSEPSFINIHQLCLMAKYH